MNENRKRPAEKQASRDDGDRGDEEFATTAQIATPEELARRRIVKAVRHPTKADPSPAPGVFGDLSGALATKSGGLGFTFGSSPQPPAGGFSFGFSSAAPPAASAERTEANETTKPANPIGFFSFSNAPGHDFASAVSQFAPKNVEEGDADPQEEVPVEATGTPLLAHVESVTGEEDERCELKAPAKLFALSKDGETAKWHERGTGELKLNVLEKDGKRRTRMVMRDQNVRKVLLNTAVDATLTVLQSGAKHFSFSGMNNGTIGSFLVKVSGQDAEVATKKIVEMLSATNSK